MRAMVTGAGGFIGANLARNLLEGGHEVLAVERPGGSIWRLDGVAEEMQIVDLDLRNGEAIERTIAEHQPEWVFHLAAHGAYSWQRDAERIMQTNLVGTVRLLSACADQGFAAFIHAGSSSEYGFRDHAPKECERVEPNSDYAAMKAAATTYAGFVAQRDDVHAVSLRLYSVFGPWEDPGRLMPALVARGLDAQLPRLVSPETPRDFVTVRDTVRAFVRAAERTEVPRGAIYNIGSGVQTRLREVVAIARAELGIETEPVWGGEAAREWDADVWVSDPRLAAAELGWRAEDDVATGFKVLADWLRERTDLWPRFGVAGRVAAGGLGGAGH